MDWLFLLGRIIYGGYFTMMGLMHFMKINDLTAYAKSKNVASPKFMVGFSGLFIFFGGLGVLLGAYVEIAVTLLSIFLVVVAFKMHNFWAIQDPNMKMAEMTQFLKNMALFGAALMVLAIPTPWVYSVLN